MRGGEAEKHYSIRTEQAYVDWIKRFIRFHGKRHPASLSQGWSWPSCGTIGNGDGVAILLAMFVEAELKIV
jgi:hypothetical protein